MAREVNIKALISHIISGDGIDRCRICMGDTSEGQVFLDDTILIEDNNPVSLADLLKSVTGVEVRQEWGLPRGVCNLCYEAITAAFGFKEMVLQSQRYWSNIDKLVEDTLNASPDVTNTSLYIFYEEKLNIPDDFNNESEGYEVKKFDGSKKLKGIKMPKATVLECPDCGKKFHVKQQLNLHLGKTRNRACNICGTVMCREEIKTHMHETHKIYIENCHLCFELFDTVDLLQHHLDESHGVNSEACQVCGEGFPAGTKSLQTHMYSHSVFYCDGCGKSFDNRRCAQHHKRVCCVTKKKTPSQPYKCNDCGQVYNKKMSLRAHITQKHSNILPFKCSYCGKRTSTASHLSEHEQTHNLERQLFQCKECPAKFKSKLGFKLHQKSHKGEKNYMCAECGETFVSASRRSDHVKRQHKAMTEFPHGCPHCTARFIRPVALRKHVKDSHFVLDESDVDTCLRLLFKSDEEIEGF